MYGPLAKKCVGVLCPGKGVGESEKKKRKKKRKRAENGQVDLVRLFIFIISFWKI